MGGVEGAVEADLERAHLGADDDGVGGVGGGAGAGGDVQTEDAPDVGGGERVRIQGGQRRSAAAANASASRNPGIVYLLAVPTTNVSSACLLATAPACILRDVGHSSKAEFSRVAASDIRLTASRLEVSASWSKLINVSWCASDTTGISNWAMSSG